MPDVHEPNSTISDASCNSSEESDNEFHSFHEETTQPVEVEQPSQCAFARTDQPVQVEQPSLRTSARTKRPVDRLNL